MATRVEIIEPQGILDGVRGNLLRQEVNAIVETGANLILIDLKNINFMDSSGLSSLVSAQRIVRSANGKLYLCSINDQVKMVFELTRMDRVFEIFANKNEFNASVVS